VIKYQGNILSLILVTATISALSGIFIWMLPFVFFLSPFIVLLGIPVGLPILYCWRHWGHRAAFASAAFSTLLLCVALPWHFAFLFVLQLIVPAVFIAAIADLQLNSTRTSKRAFIPLSTILSTIALLIAIIALILAVFVSNAPSLILLLDNSIKEIVEVLTLTRAISPLQISQFDLALRLDNYGLIVRMLALYSFVIALTNFYIASRLKHTVLPARRPRDHWPYSASSLPRIQVFLLVGASILLFFPLNATLQNCLDILSMVLLVSFTLTGLAAIHLITWNKAWRSTLLIVVYCGLGLLFGSLILAFLGIFFSSTPFLQHYKAQIKPHN